MNGRFLLSTIGLCGIFLTGCTVYDPDLLPDESPQTGYLPPRPPSSTSDPTDTGVVNFVLTDIKLNQQAGAAWRDIGLNLDELDTSADGTPGECTPQNPTADGNSGIDNRFGESLWPVIQAALPSLECEVNWAHSEGQGTLVVQISKWNGTGTDAAVEASIVPSLDGTSVMIDETDCDALDAGDGYALTEGDGVTPLAPPNLDGNDWFCLNPDGLANDSPTGQPVVIDTDAYIAAGGILVIELPATADFTLYSTRSSVSIRLGQGALVMPMDATFQTVTDGMVGGRFSLPNLADVGPPIGICNPQDLESQYELYADLRAEKPSVSNPSLDCDAISIGVAFNAVRANVAGIGPVAVPPFVSCDSGTLMPKVPWPVQDCCSAVAISDQLDCNDYWNMMP